MSSPNTCGALLPIEQRWNNPTFRRVAKGMLTPEIEVELCAFARFVGPLVCALIWRKSRSWAWQLHLRMLRVDYERAYQANVQLADEATGNRVLEVMLESGWKHGMPPEVVRMALRMRRKRGQSARQIAEDIGHGVSRHRVQDWLHPRGATRSKRAKASALLAIG